MRVRILLSILLIAIAGFGIVSTPYLSFAADTDAERAQLEAQLAELEAQIAKNQAVADKLHAEGQTLGRDVQLLDAQIAKAKLQVQATQVAIKKLAGNIVVHENTLGALSHKLTKEQESLAQILRNTDQIDDYSIVEVALSAEDISTFFSDLDTYTALKNALGESFTQIRATRVLTQKEKEALEEEQSSKLEIAQIQTLEKQKVEVQQGQKQSLLTATKGQESTYQALIKAQQQTAAQIRARIFALRDSPDINFGTAFDLAAYAGKLTNVRAALVLGILKQETDLGKNLGTGNWKVDMHPTRDVYVYQAITQTLGLNPDTQPVSKAPSYGYGGAMGPGQFIPTTWACYAGYINTSTGGCTKNPDGTWVGPWTYDASKDRIRALPGSASPENPWNNR
ncbi:MAG: hypothetical protein AAB883_00460, partial [Patescibacteria group bacterium]